MNCCDVYFLFLEHGEEVTRQADQILEKHYRERGSAGDMAGLAEAIYHANRLDWERGVDEWLETFDSALQVSNYELCRALLQVRNELTVKTNFALGRLSQQEGDFFAILARYNEAMEEYQKSIAAYDEVLKHLTMFMPTATRGVHFKALATCRHVLPSTRRR